jgi:hypothetical protein
MLRWPRAVNTLPTRVAVGWTIGKPRSGSAIKLNASRSVDGSWLDFHL